MTMLAEHLRLARTAPTVGICGRVIGVSGMTIEAVGLPAPIGSLCNIESGSDRTGGSGTPTAGGHDYTPAEVIGFREGRTRLMAYTDAAGIAPGHSIRFVTRSQSVAVCRDMLGRVVDGMGRPCDGGPPIETNLRYPLHRAAPDPLERPRIEEALSVGVRAIDGLLTCGRGGRLGVFAGTGVGKSVLMGMMARYTAADVTVVGLIGERGREVGDFLEKQLGPDGRRRSVVVVSTSDQSPLLRYRAGFVATTIAEYFRDQGADVLLLMDSVTRLAMAARQIGLAAGEPPATKGYPPSVFAALPRLLERSGRTPQGSITGLYTVLVEGDDAQDPIGDAVRGILDGHIWLSRRLAARGQYPAASVLESVSRLMPEVTDAQHQEAARLVKRSLAVWSEIEDLVNIGAYAAGTNAEYDLAIRMRPLIETYLSQGTQERTGMSDARAGLLSLAAEAKKEPARERK